MERCLYLTSLLNARLFLDDIFPCVVLTHAETYNQDSLCFGAGVTLGLACASAKNILIFFARVKNTRIAITVQGN